MKLLMLRHCPTEGNLLKKYIGRTDEPLCDEGREMARRIGVYDQVECVFTSPYKRAIETAEICFPNARKIVIDGFREYDFGDFDGLSFTDLADNPVYREWVEGNCEAGCPNGDSKESSMERANRAFRTLVNDLATTYEDKVLIIVTHNGVIMSVFSSYVRDSYDMDYFDWSVRNGEGYIADVNVGADGLPQIWNAEKIVDLSVLDEYFG
ncbi:MAG: histidine phosphatase family protein [bacterium]|nr:histidine phosphatase family protein [bacterium]